MPATESQQQQWHTRGLEEILISAFAEEDNLVPLDNWGLCCGGRSYVSPKIATVHKDKITHVSGGRLLIQAYIQDVCDAPSACSCAPDC
ncbi:MAG: hypothetical protein AB2693_15665 [Candidatus Thiodiazotropha sp.]